MFVIEQLQILGIIPNKDVKESSHANEKGCSQIEHISKVYKLYSDNKVYVCIVIRSRPTSASVYRRANSCPYLYRFFPRPDSIYR